jgi:DNA polymerase III sliding clamp (beta) subunit (PCNA family)
LKKTVTLLNKVKISSPVLPILENAFVTPNAITVTDLEVTVTVPFEGLTEDTFLVNFSSLKKLTTVKGHEDMTAIAGENQVLFGFGSKTFTFESDPLEDYPNTPTGPWKQKCSLPAELLIKTAKFACKDELRPALCGVLFDKGNIVATDGHRMHFPEVVMDTPETFIMPNNAIKLVNAKDGALSVFISECGKYSKMVTPEGVEIMSRNVDARHPGWSQVIPHEAPIKRTVSKSALIDSLSSALIVANSITKKSILNFNGCLTITAENVDFNQSFQDRMPSDGAGEIEIGVNSDFLIQIAKLDVGEDMTFEMSRPYPRNGHK